MAVTPRPELLTRHPDNPIITAADLPYSANSAFNPGATMRDDETILLMRVEDRRGLSHLTVARSSDGMAGWRIDTVPTFVAEPETYPEEIWGIEDPRVTFVEEEQRWIVAYTAYSRGGPLVSLATTEDFQTFERLGAILSPENKDAALFPVRFDGRWALVHRPVSDGFGANMWISFSPDLKHWGTTDFSSKPVPGGGGTRGRSASRRHRSRRIRDGSSCIIVFGRRPPDPSIVWDSRCSISKTRVAC